MVLSTEFLNFYSILRAFFIKSVSLLKFSTIFYKMLKAESVSELHVIYLFSIVSIKNTATVNIWITEVAYKTWISKIEPVTLDFAEGKAVLMVPGDFHRQTLIRGYMQLLNNAFESVFGTGIEIVFTVPEEIEQNEKELNESMINADYEFTFDTFIVGSSNKFAHAASQKLTFFMLSAMK